MYAPFSLKRLSLSLFAMIGCLTLVSTANGALVATISPTVLNNNQAGQTIDFFLREDTAAIDITSFDLFAQWGTGAAGQDPTMVPRFNATPNVGFVVDPALGFFGGSTTFNGGFSVSGQGAGALPATIGTTNTKIGTFVVDTTGIFDVDMIPFVIPQSADFNRVVLAAGGQQTFSLNQAVSVPEPGSFAVCGIAAAGFVARRRRKRKQASVA